MLLIFAFSGFDVAAVAAGEVRQPQRNAGIATARGLVICVFYARKQVDKRIE